MFFLGNSPLAKEPEIEKFIAELMSTAGPRLRSFIHLQQIHHLDRNRVNYNGVLAYIEKNVGEVLDPSEWVDNAYSGFYHQTGAEEFRIAQIVYDAYLPYAHKFSWLPVETNTLNYSEIYGQACKSTVAQGDPYSYLANYRTRFLLGVDTLSAASEKVRLLAGQNLGRADIIDFLAHLYTRNNEDELAANSYFAAHQSCSYYNRSHWGLVNIIRRKRHRAYSDFDKRLEIMKSEVEKLPNMDGLSTYIMNWEGLDETAKLRLKYSLRFWANHIGHLNSSRLKVYIKRGFELISQVPYMSAMRDRRVTYAGDNRLWDDIRGLGGSLVLVDLEEMMDSPFGVYNLAGHEVAHQFHYSLPQAGQQCIEKLYINAKAKNVFADPYSSTNSGEYFAQGVGFHMWPEDTPARFGLNRKWLLDNDRDLDTLLTSITTAKAIADIKCPL
jgi:hypothetical protein